MELREGYKQTEVGVIPEDWNAKQLASVCTMKSGKGITSANIHEGAKYPCYGGNGLRGYAHHFTHDGHYSLIGRQGALCGNVLGVQGQIFASEHAIVVTPSKETEIDWLTYVLGRMNLNQYSESSAQPGLSVNKLLPLVVPVPPTKTEQTAIANALSDADALIQSLTRLIAKKRQIKQGAMQTLLNPYENGRLKAGWVVKKIGSFTGATAGGTPSTLIDAYWGGDIKWMSSGELNNKYIYDVSGRITTEGLNNSATKIIPKKCVLIGLAGQGKTRGTVAINYVEICTNQSIAAVYPCQTVSSEFLYFNLDGRYNELRSLSTGDSGRGGLNLTIIKNIDVWIPQDIDEQTRIATILSDMDADIAALETKLAKTQQIKQGMMQNLLTGRIRLVNSEEKIRESA